jgi:hypothetical protein
MTLTRERLLELMSYDPETGVFTWKLSRGRQPAGAIAGMPDPRGYRSIRVDGAAHYAHRLAMLYMTGKMPAEDVDHISGEKSDNRFMNLRLASRSQNIVNARRHRDSQSGLRGVSWCKNGGCWTARIRINGRSVHLGQFQNKEDAARAYANAALLAHGEFVPEYVRLYGAEPGHAASIPPAS